MLNERMVPGHGPVRGRDTARVAVSVVSNSLLLREGLVALLAEHINLHVVGSYPGDRVPTPDLQHAPADVALIDGGIGIDAATHWTHYWRGLEPPAHVLALELPDHCDTIVAYLAGGVGGYTLRGASAAEVAAAITSVQQGVVQLTPGVTAGLLARLAQLSTPNGSHGRSIANPLTRREIEVLRYVSQECSNQQIAERLVIELRTVKHHIHSILRKLEVRHRWDAARLATERGWLAQDA